MKVLILTQTRSGTHLLWKAVPSFHNLHEFNLPLASTPGALAVALQEFFKKHLNELAVVHNHLIEIVPNSVEWIKNWHELRAMFDRVVVLTRRNRVKQFLSKLISEYRDHVGGESYDHWNCSTARQIDPQVVVDFEHYLFFRDNLRRSTDEILKIVYPYHHITYEMLVNDWEPTMRSIYKYVGIEWDDPQPATYKQESREIQQIISNWADLTKDQQRQLLVDNQPA